MAPSNLQNPVISTSKPELASKDMGPAKSVATSFSSEPGHLEENLHPEIDSIITELVNNIETLRKNAKKRQQFKLLNTQANNTVSNTLTSISKKLFKAVTKDELLNTKNKECPNKMHIFNYQNGLGGYIVSSILQDTKNPASATIKKEFWIWVMDAALKQNDFVTTMSILTALNTTPIYRLKNVGLGISEEAKKIVEKCQTLFSGSGLYENLRNKQENIEGSIPLLNPYYTKLDKTKENLMIGLQTTIRSIALENKQLLEKLIGNLEEGEITKEARKLLVDLKDGTKKKDDLSNKEQEIIGNVVFALIEKDEDLYTDLKTQAVAKNKQLKDLESNNDAKEIVEMILNKQDNQKTPPHKLSSSEDDFYKSLPFDFFENKDNQTSIDDKSRALFPRAADPEKYKGDILLETSKQAPLLKPLELAPKEKTEKIASAEILGAIKIAFHEELGDELPEAFKFMATNLQSAHNINAAFKCIGPAPRIAEIEGEKIEKLLERINNLPMNGKQRQLIRNAFSTEISLNPNKRDTFEIAITNNQFTYKGINSILSTLKENDNITLPSILQTADTNQLKEALIQYSENAKIRQLIFEIYKSDIEKVSGENKSKFILALFENPLTNVSAINNAIINLDSTLQLPPNTTDETLEEILTNAATTNHYKKLIFDIIKSELRDANYEDFKDTLSKMTHFTTESVSQLLHEKVNIELPAEENLEQSLQQLKTVLYHKRYCIGLITEMSNYLERIPKILNRAITALDKAIKPTLTPSDQESLSKLLLPYKRMEEALHEVIEKIQKPTLLATNTESLNYIGNIINSLSDIAKNEAVACAFAHPVLEDFLKTEINTNKILEQATETNIPQNLNELDFAIAFQCLLKYDLFTRDLIKHSAVTIDKNTNKTAPVFEAF